MTTIDRAYVTVVSGLPRSGTSLMMQMLAAGGMPVLTDELRGPDPDNPRGYYEFEPVKRSRHDPSWLVGTQGKAVKLVHLLLYDLPPEYCYRVIFMKRRLSEVLASQRAMLDRQGKKGANLSHARLGEIYESQLGKLEIWLNQQSNFSVLSVDYNELIADPRIATDAIASFVEGGLDIIAMTKMVDPLLYRQRA